MNVDMDRKWNQIIDYLDRLYQKGDRKEVERFLMQQYDMSISSGEKQIALGILNEQLGFYRVTTQHEKALAAIDKTLLLLSEMGISEEIQGGTTLLNVATVYRAMGKYEEAQDCYLQAEKIYQKKMEPSDYRMAGLYNNISLLYQEQGKEALAAHYLKQALEIVCRIPDGEIQTAITHTNLGQVYCKMGKWESAKQEFDAAEEIFLHVDETDEHISGLWSALGYWHLEQKNYDTSITYYEKALWRMYQSYGRTEHFKSIQKDLRVAYRKKGMPEYASMMELCRAYYESYGKPMIREHFGQYENQIAVGLCGEGSECFGLEDEISLDHDCGPGFALWVTDQVYAEIGQALQEEYEKLPKVFAGHIRMETGQGSGRCGVCKIQGYFQRVLGTAELPETEEDWGRIEESALATAISGKVFSDPLGEFEKGREKLKQYYPDRVWREKLAKELIYAAQTGQYNYGREMARGDYVTASIVLAEYMKSIMHVVFLLNRQYTPYYKWQRAMIKSLPLLAEIGDILEAICDMPSQRKAWQEFSYDGNPNPEDMIAQTIEIVAKLVTHTLQEMGLSTSNDPYLEVQGRQVIQQMWKQKQQELENQQQESGQPQTCVVEQLIEEIVRFEWMEFDLVKNEGGRADCQNNWDTFSIMRKSQYMTWTEDMLHEYLWHLQDSFQKGRNLITEKYGRMMASTAPERYEEIKGAFPELSEQRIQIMESIIQIQVSWMEAFAKEYPNMAMNARIIHTYEDTPYDTSYETYLRGELGTYTDALIQMYAQFIVELSREGKNLAYLTMDYTAKLYGYENVEDAEAKMSKIV